MIRAAIFDLDGVVLDSMSIWRDLGARYLLHRGLTPEPGLGELLFSMSMEQGADYLRTHYPLPPEEDVLADLSRHAAGTFYYNEVPGKGRSLDGSGLSAGPGQPSPPPPPVPGPM